MVERAGHELFFFFLGKFYHPPPTNVFEVVWGQVEGGMRDLEVRRMLSTTTFCFFNACNLLHYRLRTIINILKESLNFMDLL